MNKIAMLADSTTAAVKWFNIHLPEYDVDHLCAKGKRFLHWADKIAYSAIWPMCTRHLPGEKNCLAHMLRHVGDVLTTMGKHGDGKLTAAEALRSEHINKGYLQYLTESMEEVSAGVYAMQAMEVLSVKIMSMFKCHRQRNTISAATVAVSLHSYHGVRDNICEDRCAKPAGFEVRHLNFDADDHAEMVRAYQADDSAFHKVDLKHVYQCLHYPD